MTDHSKLINTTFTIGTAQRRTGTKNGKIYYSYIQNPNEFPNVRTIWCGHPLIAKYLAIVLNKLFRLIGRMRR